jgi:hypothetical protein
MSCFLDVLKRMHDMADKQTLRVGALYGIGALGGLALAYGLAGPSSRALGPAGTPLVMVLAAVWALAFAGAAWKRTDEPAREAHKFAAFWGAPFAMLALVVGLPLYAALALHAKVQPGMALAGAAPAPWVLVWVGVMLAGVVQMAGYGLAWAGWWLRR